MDQAPEPDDRNDIGHAAGCSCPACLPEEHEPPRAASAMCDHCGENPAACRGSYEMAPEANACDTCCGHGCENGWCESIDGSSSNEHDMVPR